MRIRKHASKVLGTASSQNRSSPPPATAVDLSAATYMMQQAYSCEVNISRWDVFPFPSLCEPSDKEEEQENATMGDGNEEEMMKEEDQSMSAITSHSITAEPKPIEKEPDASILESEEEYTHKFKPKRKKKPNKANKGKKTSINTVRAAGMEEESQYIETSATADTTYTCKKTDGKQWRCKVSVHQPNSLCDYHLGQLLSYRCTSKAKWPAPARKATDRSCSRSQLKSPRTSVVATSESMDYYSAFEPWRGKQRGGKPAAVAVAVKEESEEEQLEQYVSSRSNDDDNNEDDSDKDSLEEEDSEEESKTGELIRGRKKKRRPVKARSLKSLL